MGSYNFEQESPNRVQLIFNCKKLLPIFYVIPWTWQIEWIWDPCIWWPNKYLIFIPTLVVMSKTLVLKITAQTYFLLIF